MPGRYSSVPMPSLWLAPIDVILFKTSLSSVKLLVGDNNYKVHVGLWAIISYLYSYSLRKYGLIYLCSPSFIARKNSLITHRIYNAHPPPPYENNKMIQRVLICRPSHARLTRGRILGRNTDKKVFRVFLLAIHSHLCSIALRFLFLHTHTTSYGFLQLLYTAKEKGGKGDRKPYLCPCPWFKKFTATSGVLSFMIEKLAQAGEGGVCTATPFHYIQHHIQSCGLLSS